MTEYKIVTNQGTYTTDKPETPEEQIKRLRWALDSISRLSYQWDTLPGGAGAFVVEARKISEEALSKQERQNG